MPRIQFLVCLLFCASLQPQCLCQPSFAVIPATLPSAEGGSANVLLMEVGKAQFSLRVPNGYGIQVNEESRSIVFTAADGTSAITVRVTTNFPATLPRMEDLRDMVAKKYPGASVVQSGPCVSDYGTGLCFDFVQPAQNGLALRIRDAYVPCPTGSFEFIFSCNGDDYDKNRLSFAW
ncbi:MAG: hypothetical protein ACLQVW_15945 [Limisphaerales bacterium]